jgi:hypothetical protein
MITGERLCRYTRAKQIAKTKTPPNIDYPALKASTNELDGRTSGAEV